MTQRDEVVRDLNALAKEVAELQRKYEIAGPEWHALENVDDVIFNQLKKLGD